MRKTILNFIFGGSLGLFLANIGFDVLHYQFWIIFLLVGCIQINASF